MTADSMTRAREMLWEAMTREMATWPRGFDPENDVAPNRPQDWAAYRGDWVANAACDALAALLTREAEVRGEEREREWPDIGPDPFQGPRENDNVKAAHKRLRDAYAKQQPIVPDQTALVWRIDIGRVHQRMVQLDALFADQDECSTPPAIRGDGMGEG